MKTGRPIVNPDKNTKLGTIVHDICPTASGAKDWEPVILLAAHRLFVHPAREPLHGLGERAGQLHRRYALCRCQCGDEAGTRRYSAVRSPPGIVAAGKPAWQIPEDLPAWSGSLATAGDLVFYGTMDGWFKAVDAKTGALKWRFKTGSGIIGQPVAYRGSDGREFIAILSGVGGWSGAIVPGNLNARDPLGALWVSSVPWRICRKEPQLEERSMSSLYHHPERALAAAALLVTSLGLSASAAPNPALPVSQALPLDVPVGGNFPNGETEPPLDSIAKQYQNNAQAISDGARLFDWFNCSGCHFHGAGGIGPAFDNDGQWIYGGRLDQIYASIYQGRPNGMPMWGKIIPSSAIWELAAYVKSLSTKSASEATPTKPVAAAPGPATLETEPDQMPPSTPAASQ